MPVLFTTIAHVTDWKALREANRTRLLGRATAAGAKRFQVYRNVNDASQVLIVAELPDHDAVREMSQALAEQLAELRTGSLSDDREWEPTGWEGIGQQIGQQKEALI